MTAPPLQRCPGCGWYTHQLQPGGRCLDCTLGWIACPAHARLEHAGSPHRRVTVAEVLAALRRRSEA